MEYCQALNVVSFEGLAGPLAWPKGLMINPMIKSWSVQPGKKCCKM